MEVSTSIFGALRKAIAWAYSVAEKRVCRRAYEISTTYHHHRELIEAPSYPLGEHLGYRLFWDEYLHGVRQRAPTLEVRAKDGVLLSSVVISVMAENDKVCYQDEVVLRHVDGRRHCAALMSIPFRRLKIEGAWVYTPYDSFRVELMEVCDEQGNSLKPPGPIVHTTHPVDRLEVVMGKERDHVEKWGEVYHLRFVEMGINDEMVRMLGWRFHQPGWLQKLSSPLMHRGVAKALFWAKNAGRARPLQRALEQHVLEYREYVAARSGARTDSVEAPRARTG